MDKPRTQQSQPALDRPAFESLSDALNFAYRRKPSTLQRSPWMKMVPTSSAQDSDGQPPRSRNPELGPMPYGYEAAALQGSIKRDVESRPEQERDHLLAKFALGIEQKEAQRRLVAHVTPLVDRAACPEWIVGRLVRHFYGQGSGRLAHLAVNLAPNVPQRVGEKPENYRRRLLRVLQSARQTVVDFLQSLATYSEDAVYSALKERRIVL